MSRRILLADDSVTIQKVIELTFMDDDYEVRAVGNGDEALAMLGALQVDFVIADVHMPGASGYEVCRRSKQQRPQVPVLLLVGTFEPFDEAQARDCGADAFLKKPFDSQELLGRVHQLLGSATSQAAAAEPPAAAPAGTAGSHFVEPDSLHLPDLPPLPASPFLADAEPPAAVAPASHLAASPPLPPPLAAAESWQQFELEAEPEAPPVPWMSRPAVSTAAHPATDFAGDSLSGAGAVGLEDGTEQPFALGDLEGEPLHQAAAAAPSGASAPAFSFPQPAAATPFTLSEPAPAVPAAPAAPAFGHDSPFLSAPEPAAAPAFAAATPAGGAGGIGASEAPGATEAPAPADREREDVAVPFDLGATAGGAAFALEAASAAAAAVPQSAPAAPASPFAAAEPAAPTPSPAPSTATTPSATDAATTPPAPATGAAPEAAPAAAAPPPPPAAPAQDAQAAPVAPVAPLASNTAGAMSDADVERIARRVVELLGDKVVRDVAWEVIPDLAEVVIKDRLRELESQVE